MDASVETRSTTPLAETTDLGLDQLLAEAARRSSRRLPGTGLAKVAWALANKPRASAALLRNSARELGDILAGSSTPVPPKGDRRFRDPAWENWLFRRLLQSYLSLSENAREGLELAELDWATEQRLRVSLENLIEGLAPTNFPLTNPAALKATVDHGGANFVRGARQLVRDLRTPTHLPASVDPAPFKIGETLAASKGAVVHRTERFELLQYAPVTAEVQQVPVLIVPPMISKFYVVDLAPGKSMVEHLGAAGLQCFAVSWRNVGRRHADWGLSDYVDSILEAIETTRAITRSDKVHLVGFCAGGLATSIVAGYLAAQGRGDELASLNVNVTVLDMQKGAPLMGFSSPELARAAAAQVRRRGYLPGAELTRTFAWLRPTDMIWNNFVNNYYLGGKPPALDLLYWNLDAMNMPAALHGDMMAMGIDNPLPGGELRVHDTPIDLSAVDCDTYVAAGETDHLTPWPSCYRSSRLFGGHTRFVLSTGGHIAAVIHPEGNPKSAYWTADNSAEDADSWLENAEQHSGSWWGQWRNWLLERSGDSKRAPRRLGNARFKPLQDAPGRYVTESATSYARVD